MSEPNGQEKAMDERTKQFVNKMADVVLEHLKAHPGFTFHPVYIAESAIEPMAEVFNAYSLPAPAASGLELLAECSAPPRRTQPDKPLKTTADDEMLAKMCRFASPDFDLMSDELKDKWRLAAQESLSNPLSNPLAKANAAGQGKMPVYVTAECIADNLRALDKAIEAITDDQQRMALSGPRTALGANLYADYYDTLPTGPGGKQWPDSSASALLTALESAWEARNKREHYTSPPLSGFPLDLGIVEEALRNLGETR